jgi:hypothetical protein
MQCAILARQPFKESSKLNIKSDRPPWSAYHASTWYSIDFVVTHHLTRNNSWLLRRRRWKDPSYRLHRTLNYTAATHGKCKILVYIISSLLPPWSHVKTDCQQK